MTTNETTGVVSPYDTNGAMEYSFFPIRNPELESFYQQQKEMFWVPAEIDFAGNISEWNRLDPSVKRYITFILCFFSQSDGIIVENLMENFKKETSLYKEARFFYSMQEAIETIHNETYSILLDTFITDPVDRANGLDAIHCFPSIGKMAHWMFKYMDPSRGSLLERVIAFACAEGIFFSSAFCSIYWLKRQNMLDALCQANQLIAADEALHVKFAGELYKHLIRDGYYTSLPERTVHSIIQDAVAVVSEFTRDALNVDLIGLSADEMVDYIKCCGDEIAVMFGYAPVYHTTNPFVWMNTLSLPKLTNFFESRNLTYNRAKVDTEGVFVDDTSSVDY